MVDRANSAQLTLHPQVFKELFRSIDGPECEVILGEAFGTEIYVGSNGGEIKVEQNLLSVFSEARGESPCFLRIVQESLNMPMFGQKFGGRLLADSGDALDVVGGVAS